MAHCDICDNHWFRGNSGFPCNRCYDSRENWDVTDSCTPADRSAALSRPLSASMKRLRAVPLAAAAAAAAAAATPPPPVPQQHEPSEYIVAKVQEVLCATQEAREIGLGPEEPEDEDEDAEAEPFDCGSFINVDEQYVYEGTYPQSVVQALTHPLPLGTLTLTPPYYMQWL
jgi:hypothetical protein